MTSLTRTPLSSRAKAFTPKTDMWSSRDESPASAQMMMMPMFFPNEYDFQADAYELQMIEPEKSDYRRGRTWTKGITDRLPSRTPSPSGWSNCHSEVSTTQEGSIVGTISSSDLTDNSEDLSEFQDLPVKNTFVHFSNANVKDFGQKPMKMSRSLSAPNILLTCQFMALTMMDLHEVGRCSPCAYLYGKADGCRRGSTCKFCHACPPDELKNRKKARAKDIKVRRAMQQVESERLMLCGGNFADE